MPATARQNSWKIAFIIWDNNTPPVQAILRVLLNNHIVKTIVQEEALEEASGGSRAAPRAPGLAFDVVSIIPG